MKLSNKRIFLGICVLVMMLCITVVLSGNISLSSNNIIAKAEGQSFTLTFDDENDLDYFSFFSSGNDGQQYSKTVESGKAVFTRGTAGGEHWVEWRLGKASDGMTGINVKALQNYEITMDLKIVSGQFYIGGRLYSHENRHIQSDGLYLSLNYEESAGIHSQLYSRADWEIDGGSTGSYQHIDTNEFTLNIKFFNDCVYYSINNGDVYFKYKEEYAGRKGEFGFQLINIGSEKAATVEIDEFTFMEILEPAWTATPQPPIDLEEGGINDFKSFYSVSSDLDKWRETNFNAGQASLQIANGALLLENTKYGPNRITEFGLRDPNETKIALDDYVIGMDVTVWEGAFVLAGRTAYRTSLRTQSTAIKVDENARITVGEYDDGIFTRQANGDGFLQEATFRLYLKAKGNVITVRIDGGAEYEKTFTFVDFDGERGSISIGVENGGNGDLASVMVDNVQFLNGDVEIPESAPLEFAGKDDFTLFFTADDYEDNVSKLNSFATTNYYGGNGGYSFNEEKQLILTTGVTGIQYAETALSFDANQIGNFSLMMEVEIQEGMFFIGTRAQLGVPITTAGMNLTFNMQSSTVVSGIESRQGGEVTAYPNTYRDLGTKKFVFNIIMIDNEMSVYIGSSAVALHNKFANGHFDTIYKGEKGDIVFAVINQSRTDMATTIIKKIQFANATGENNNVFPAWPNENFKQEEYIAKIYRKNTFTPETHYITGSTVSLDLKNYFEAEFNFEDLIFLSKGDIGSIDNNTFTAVLDESGKYTVSIIAYHGDSSPVSLMFELDVYDKASGGIATAGIVGIAAGIIVAVIAAAIFLTKQRTKRGGTNDEK